MAVADLVLTKPGGLTTSEVLACGAAMAVVNPIPGQESRNSDFLLENGAAIKINNIGTMRTEADRIAAGSAEAGSAQEQCRKLARARGGF